MKYLLRISCISIAISLLLLSCSLSTEESIPQGDTFLPSSKLQLIYPDSTFGVYDDEGTYFKWDELDASGIGTITYTLCLEIKGEYYLELYNGTGDSTYVSLVGIPYGEARWYVNAQGSITPNTYCTSEKRKILIKNSKSR